MQHHEAFRQLNQEWLEKFGLLEPPDIEVLNDPQATILDKGGAIYLAEEDGVIVGSAAIVPDHGDCFELVKMSVAPSWRGRGISKLLIQRCLDKAREIGVGRIILFSNSQLQTAISLYSQYGFQHVPVEDSPFLTADVKMELVL
jgi:putative acetyltransferase